MTITQTIAHAILLGLDRLDSQLLLLHVMGKAPSERGWLLAHDGDVVPAAVAMAFEHAVAQRKSGIPMAYITGHAAFYGLDLQVDERVLIPRPDTETLVDWALEIIGSAGAQLDETGAPWTRGQLIDLGTGSGAVALALKQALQTSHPELAVSATDISASALAVARANARRLQLEVNFIQASWFDAVPGRQLGRFHWIVANPPYIALGDAHLPALQHEPASALTSGADGLDAIRQIVRHAPVHLQPGGWLLLEHGYDQAARVRALLTQAGFRAVRSRRDLGGNERCSIGCWPA